MARPRVTKATCLDCNAAKQRIEWKAKEEPFKTELKVVKRDPEKYKQMVLKLRAEMIKGKRDQRLVAQYIESFSAGSGVHGSGCFDSQPPHTNRRVSTLRSEAVLAARAPMFCFGPSGVCVAGVSPCVSNQGQDVGNSKVLQEGQVDQEVL